MIDSSTMYTIIMCVCVFDRLLDMNCLVCFEDHVWFEDR
jgi:hypothetical protein